MADTDEQQGSNALALALREVEFRNFIMRNVGTAEHSTRKEKFMHPYPSSAPQCAFESWQHANAVILATRYAYLNLMGLNDPTTDGWQRHDDVIFGHPFTDYALSRDAIQVLCKLTETAVHRKSDNGSPLHFCQYGAFNATQERILFASDLHFTLLREMQQAVGVMFFSTNETAYSIAALRMSQAEYKRVLVGAIEKYLPDILSTNLVAQTHFVPDLLSTGFVADLRPPFAYDFPIACSAIVLLAEAFAMSQHIRLGARSSASLLDADCLGKILSCLFKETSKDALCFHQNTTRLLRSKHTLAHAIYS